MFFSALSKRSPLPPPQPSSPSAFQRSQQARPAAPWVIGVSCSLREAGRPQPPLPPGGWQGQGLPSAGLAAVPQLQLGSAPPHRPPARASSPAPLRLLLPLRKQRTQATAAGPGSAAKTSGKMGEGAEKHFNSPSLSLLSSSLYSLFAPLTCMLTLLTTTSHTTT